MNRLWVRLTLAFILITVIGVGSVVLLVDWSAGSEFRQYVARQGMVAQSGLVDQLAAYYRQNGSWRGVETVFAGFSGAGGRGRGMGGTGSGRGGGPSLMLADAGGRIVYDEQGTSAGQTLSPAERANGVGIQVDGSTVGYLLAVAPGASSLQPAAQSFLDQLRTTLLLAGLIAAGAGILLGLVLSRNLAGPLANLAGAAHAMAGHQLDRRVSVKGADEVAEVARAFNEMAEELQASDTARRNMVADIAHELRTPLTVMQGNLRAILDGIYPLERSEIATLYDETRMLGRLVEDLRELTLADAGQLPLNRQATDMASLLKGAAARFSIPADEQGIQLTLLTGRSLPHVRADPDRLAQVLDNLVSNALRHTPRGGAITLAAESDDTSRSVRTRVSDTGEGIRAADLGRVFDRFYRADAARGRGSGNIGLGLAIAKAWIEAMGGQIGVESAVGKGTSFWFTLPRA